jgi:hypothetical protein
MTLSIAHRLRTGFIVCPDPCSPFVPLLPLFAYTLIVNRIDIQE